MIHIDLKQHRRINILTHIPVVELMLMMMLINLDSIVEIKVIKYSFR